MIQTATKQIVIKQPSAPATEPQKAYIRTLAAQRPAWKNYHDRIALIIATVLMDEDVVGKGDASLAIERLLSIKPTLTPDAGIVVAGKVVAGPDPVKNAVQAVLVDLPISRYALPRSADPNTWDFFQVCEAKTTKRRYVVQLLGSPGDWQRKWLAPEIQLIVAKHIAEAPKESAIAYAEQHGRCSVCNAHLSKKESIEQSMGPVCAKRFK